MALIFSVEVNPEPLRIKVAKIKISTLEEKPE